MRIQVHDHLGQVLYAGKGLTVDLARALEEGLVHASREELVPLLDAYLLDETLCELACELDMRLESARAGMTADPKAPPRRGRR